MRNQVLSRYTFAFVFPLLFAAFAGVLFLHAGQKKGAAGSIFVSDKGKLKILLDGKSIGQEEFEIVPSAGGWLAKGTTRLSPEGSPASTVTGSLTLQPDGAPISYDWTAQTDKTNGAKILFANGVAKMTIQLQGARPFEQDLTFTSPLVVVLDDNLYYQYAVLARVYDWNRRGTQTFPVIVPQELLPGTITVDWAGAVTAEGKSYEGLKVVTSDLEIILYLDPNHRLMRLEVPSAKAAVVRE
jgi:phage baseplate assembly protein gpV